VRYERACLGPPIHVRNTCWRRHKGRSPLALPGHYKDAPGGREVQAVRRKIDHRLPGTEPIADWAMRRGKKRRNDESPITTSYVTRRSTSARSRGWGDGSVPASVASVGIAAGLPQAEVPPEGLAETLPCHGGIDIGPSTTHAVTVLVHRGGLSAGMRLRAGLRGSAIDSQKRRCFGPPSTAGGRKFGSEMAVACGGFSCAHGRSVCLGPGGSRARRPSFRHIRIGSHVQHPEIG
jgi:hypothetical protein